MPLPLPDPQLPGNPQDALQSIQRNFEALAQTLAPPVPTGTVLPYAAATAPEGYLICDGSEVPVASYPALDALLGTTYGARTNGLGGSGTSHFRLPDLQGRVVVSRGTHSSVNDLGENDGTAVSNRRPTHSHAGGVHSHTASSSDAGGHSHTYDDHTAQSGVENYVRTGNQTAFNNNTVATRTTNTVAAHSHPITVNDSAPLTVGSTGGTTDAPSYIVLNHIIKA